jgi:hypothetical protein
MKAALLLGGLVFVQYATSAINTRMVARGSYLGTAISDVALLLFSFAIIQHVAKADSLLAQIGYIVGGVAGGCAGIWLSRHPQP